MFLMYVPTLTLPKYFVKKIETKLPAILRPPNCPSANSSNLLEAACLYFKIER